MPNATGALATPNRAQLFFLLMTPSVLCAASLLCGCNSKSSQVAKDNSAVAPVSESNQNPASGQSERVQPSAEVDKTQLNSAEIASGNSIVAGAKAAAEFGVRHQRHVDLANFRTWQSVNRFGMVVQYPPDWQLNPSVPDSGPIALNTFQSHYSERGGHFPNHGAEIDISYMPKPSGSVQQVLSTDLKGSDDLKIEDSPIAIDSTKAVQASYSDSFKGYLTHEVVAVYVEHGTGLYKFFLTYHKGEAWGPGFESDFDNILKSVKFNQ
jgi:hypothetical protein